MITQQLEPPAHELPGEHPRPGQACLALGDKLRTMLSRQRETRNLRCELVCYAPTCAPGRRPAYYVEIHADGDRVGLPLDDADRLLTLIETRRKDFLSRFPRMTFHLTGRDILKAAASFPAAIIDGRAHMSIKLEQPV